MMKRTIIEIDEERCDGCGICADACHEGAIGILDGKAKLLRDDYCDGLGDCLPACPQGAISFVEREAAAYDEKAVARAKAFKAVIAKSTPSRPTSAAGCPGSNAQALADRIAEAVREKPHHDEGPVLDPHDTGSALSQWPVQIRLLPTSAPFYDGADLLVAADCTAYACGDFHSRFVSGRTTLVGCPKLDPVDYTEKLMEIIGGNDVRSVTLVRMQVPCCGGLERAARAAVEASGKDIPFEVVVLSSDGLIVS